MKKMKTIVKIEGMKCKNCANHVYDSLSSIDNILKVKVSLKDKEAIIISNNSLNNDEIKNIIENIGYQVMSITKE